jgi:hypothetical protein
LFGPILLTKLCEKHSILDQGWGSDRLYPVRSRPVVWKLGDPATSARSPAAGGKLPRRAIPEARWLRPPASRSPDLS